jgi:hypothetical protein
MIHQNTLELADLDHLHTEKESNACTEVQCRDDLPSNSYAFYLVAPALTQGDAF